MKTFNDFISDLNEKREPIMRADAMSYAKKKPIIGEINPSVGQLEALKKRTPHGVVRFVVDGDSGTLYAFDGYESLHNDVVAGEGLWEEKVCLGIFDNDDSTNPRIKIFDHKRSHPQYGLRHPTLKKLAKKLKIEMEVRKSSAMAEETVDEAYRGTGKDKKGWINPKTRKAILTTGYTPYHVQMVVKNLSKFGLTKKKVLDVLKQKYEEQGVDDPALSAKEAFRDLLDGSTSVDRDVEYMAMEKGWYRVVGGDWCEIGGPKNMKDKGGVVQSILEIMEENGVIDSENFEVVEFPYYYKSKDAVYVEFGNSLRAAEIKDLFRGKRARKRTEIGATMAMFRGESVEDVTKDKPKRKWFSLKPATISKNTDLSQNLYSIISNTYAPIGGYPDYKQPSDLPGDNTDWIAVDIDKDPEVDAVRFGKKTAAGNKMTGSATDGSPAAKKMLLNKTAKLLNSKGYYVEVSAAMAHIMLTKYDVPIVSNPDVVKKVLAGKKITWVGLKSDGKYPEAPYWYSRMIGGKMHQKIMLGRPLV